MRQGTTVLAVGTREDGAERALEIDGAGGEFVRLVFSCDRREHLARKIIEVLLIKNRASGRPDL